MGVDWNVCDHCDETYPDCWDMATTEDYEFSFCWSCVDRYDLYNKDKCNENGEIKKEFYEVKEIKIIKREIVFK